ncbi:LptF/LptG family permease [Algoriphagus pacificus]|uniref:LptF/LptG family permease n=1 Tax=Algoriphagus pacificus TaxID=2811234 RepID=A0ABS3CI87_9BACT|nr:LptF/LptG family permease [Algoriphagus pacificus]MBN7816813.1 LptF/LptG family permease [Algoriphagus pacificus]
MKKLDKLILGSFIGPFLLTFLVVDFILLTVNMLKYFDEIFGKGLGFWIYMELISYFVISISPMALPLAVLLSSLMTFGNLGEHFELTAIKSSGISLVRALRPIGVFVVILSFAAYLSNNHLVPKVNLKTFSLLYDIRMKSPAFDIKEGVFYNGIPGFSIKVNKKLDDVRLKDIIIYSHNGPQGNLDVTLADSGRMEPFFNDNYMRMTLYNGTNYNEERNTRGINEKPVNFTRAKFDENEIIFSLDAFQMDRTPEDLWSTNRAIKDIEGIKLGLDSINTLVNDKIYQNYQATEANFSFYTRNRKLEPLPHVKERRVYDDSLRQLKMEKERAITDSLGRLKEKQDSTQRAKVLEDQKPPSVNDGRNVQGSVTNVAKSQNSDSLFLKKREIRRNDNAEIDSISDQDIETGVVAIKKVTSTKYIRTEPLTEEEKARIDSAVYDKGLITNAMTMASNNARNLKNSYDIKKSQIDTDEREFRRYQIAWYQKYTQAFACFAMFLIGAPLGAIIKKGGLGMPVLISIIFFIIFYMLTISGEKWAKEGLVDPLFGTWFSNLCLIPFGLFFLKQARKDARLFEPDFYLGIWKSIQKRVKVLQSKSA